MSDYNTMMSSVKPFACLLGQECSTSVQAP
jgi:hypothetical protein